MPAAHNVDSYRIDSVGSDAASPTRPPLAQLWLSILDSTNDATNMTTLAQDLLSYIWPKKNSAQVIDSIGNSSKKFDDAEDAELRIALRELLFPAYEALNSRHY
jgi:hypothetical protein